MREQAEVNQSQQTEVCSLAGPLFVDITGFVEEQIISLVLQLNVCDYRPGHRQEP